MVAQMVLVAVVPARVEEVRVVLLVWEEVEEGFPMDQFCDGIQIPV